MSSISDSIRTIFAPPRRRAAAPPRRRAAAAAGHSGGVTFALVFVSVFAAVRCAAQPSVDAKAWLDKRVTLPYKMPNVENVKFTCSVEWMATWTDSELAAAQREVEGHPEHPKAFQVIREVARRKPGGDIETFRVWWKSATEYRVSWDIPVGGNLPWNDVACRKDESWQLTGERNLTIGLGANDPSSIPATIWGVRSMVDPILFTCVRTELAASPGPMTKMFDVRDDGGWTGRILTSDGEVFLRLVGRWDARNGRAFIREVTSDRNRIFGFQAHRRVYESWQYVGELDDFVATEVRDYSENNTLLETIRFGPLEHMTPEEFEFAARTPTLADADILRGTVEIENIMDETKSTKTLSRFDSKGMLLDSVPTGLTRSGADHWRIAGWVGLGGLCVALSFLRWRALVSPR